MEFRFQLVQALAQWEQIARNRPTFLAKTTMGFLMGFIQKYVHHCVMARAPKIKHVPTTPVLMHAAYAITTKHVLITDALTIVFYVCKIRPA